ncbi:MAG: phenylalanine--tRNA ligase beta subunit-related protein [Candidatus Paceibacterota bacterium]
MKVSYNWLQTYFKDKLPEPQKIADVLTMHAFEVEEMEKLGNDTILNINVLPDRSHDALSHKGIAKEISTLFDIKIKNDESKEKFDFISSGKYVQVEIKNPQLCRRYTTAFLKNVKVGPSPVWLRERLEALEQKSINNVVDATNYVMFNVGQPLHAFDASRLSQSDGQFKIDVRNAEDGERIVTLTGEEVLLEKDELIIADGNSNKPLAIAGIKGGKEAEITEDTKDIILESANFEPGNVRVTSKKVGIRTDSSLRFEHGISRELAIVAMNDLINLIKEIAGGEEIEIKEVVDYYPAPISPFKVGVSMREINSLLGLELKESEVVDILNRFGFSFEKIEPLKKVFESAPKFVGVPYKFGASVRVDAPNYFDCSSFVSYLYAMVGISIPRTSIDQYVWSEHVSKDDIKPGDLIFSNTKIGKIHYETLEFMKGYRVEEGIDHVGLYLGEGKIIHSTRYKDGVVLEDLEKSEQFKNITGFGRVVNSDEERFVVTVPFERLDIRIKEDLIEEVGRVYGYEKITSKPPRSVSEKPVVNKINYYSELVRNVLTNRGFSEVYTYSFVSSGEIEVQKPLASDKKFLRTNLSQNIKSALDFNLHNAPLLALNEIKIFEIGKIFNKENERVSLSVGIAYMKEKKGVKVDEEIKEILEYLIKELSLPITASDIDEINKIGGVMELDFEKLIEALPEPKEAKFNSEIKEIKYKPISVYPFMLRDIAVFVPESIKYDEVLSLIKKEATELLININAFDIFTKKFPDGSAKTSYAFHLVFQSYEKTLTDEEIGKIMEGITNALNSNEGWQVR